LSYEAVDQSVEGGKPIELFLFQSTGTQFAYTTSPTEITHNSILYTPASIDRPEPSLTALYENKPFEITIPATDPLVNPRYVRTVPPSRETVTIYRKHLSDPEAIILFAGEIKSVRFENNYAKISCHSVSELMDHAIPYRSFSSLCSHILYDRGCKMNEFDFETDLEVQAVGADYIDVTGTGLSALGATYFRSGMVVHGSLERRMILAQTVLGPDQARFSILLAFPGVGVGSLVKAYAGCDHTTATCITKFNNMTNYGGFPWVPARNPFEGIE
jgi:uncharacterized phage protein (TIGR02218 family)